MPRRDLEDRSHGPKSIGSPRALPRTLPTAQRGVGGPLRHSGARRRQWRDLESVDLNGALPLTTSAWTRLRSRVQATPLAILR